MLDWFWLVPAFPLGGFLILTLGPSLRRSTAARLYVGISAMATGLSAWLAMAFMNHDPYLAAYSQPLWTWVDLDGFVPRVALYVDALSMTMVLVVTGIGFLVSLYSTEYMQDDEDYQRYFAYMNLFLGSMLILVLADHFLLLFLGWEGVGMCSYLLIGFWYRDPFNGFAARKAFIVNRIGDTAMIVGLCLLFTELDTLEIQSVLRRASLEWTVGTPLAVVAAALLLGGAVGKSAQIPLQIWLPDAMAGPTPVSALIHSATMVTAGVYLIARTQSLFALAPPVQTAVVVIGTTTMLLAAWSALAQRDIKRVFAFSTISQLGYMFMALGVGSAGAAIFHLLTHACFKALLFLMAGAVMFSLHHERILSNMGGLRRELPVVFWCAVIGAASLSGFPFVTAGSFSKDLILEEAWRSPAGGTWLLLAGLFGIVLTAMYSFRAVFLAFFGEKRHAIERVPGWRMTVPLVALAALSIVSGWLGWSQDAEEPSWFLRVIHTAIPVHEADVLTESQADTIRMLASGAAFLGLFVAYLLYGRYPAPVERATETAPAQAVRHFLHRIAASGTYDRLVGRPLTATVSVLRKGVLDQLYKRVFVRPFVILAESTKDDVVDQAYDRLFVRPFLWIARVNRDDWLDRIYEGLTWFVGRSAVAAQLLQTGRVRWYAMILAGGAIGLGGFAVMG